ncbi:MAG: hypothetical protein GY883_17320 [Shimia sp.]|nr:hypothetical protein [Shimia sp.]
MFVSPSNSEEEIPHREGRNSGSALFLVKISGFGGPSTKAIRPEFSGGFGDVTVALRQHSAFPSLCFICVLWDLSKKLPKQAAISATVSDEADFKGKKSVEANFFYGDRKERALKILSISLR